MMDARNVVTLMGGIVSDPERPVEKLVKFRLAVDMAGRETGEDGKRTTASGYFDVAYWIGDDPNSKFVDGQVKAGNLKKGSQVIITGRLEHDRFKTKDGQNASRVSVVAESMSYAGGRKPDDANGERPAAAAGAAAPAAAGGTVPMMEEF